MTRRPPAARIRAIDTRRRAPCCRHTLRGRGRRDARADVRLRGRDRKFWPAQCATPWDMHRATVLAEPTHLLDELLSALARARTKTGTVKAWQCRLLLLL